MNPYEKPCRRCPTAICCRSVYLSSCRVREGNPCTWNEAGTIRSAITPDCSAVAKGASRCGQFARAMSLDKGRAEAEKRQTGRSARGARQQDQQQLKVDAALEEDWSVDDYSWHPTALTATRNASRSKTLVARQSVPIRLHPRQEEGTRGRAGAKCQVYFHCTPDKRFSPV